MILVASRWNDKRRRTSTWLALSIVFTAFNAADTGSFPTTCTNQLLLFLLLALQANPSAIPFTIITQYHRAARRQQLPPFSSLWNLKSVFFLQQDPLLLLLRKLLLLRRLLLQSPKVEIAVAVAKSKPLPSPLPPKHRCRGSSLGRRRPKTLVWNNDLLSTGALFRKAILVGLLIFSLSTLALAFTTTSAMSCVLRCQGRGVCLGMGQMAATTTSTMTLVHRGWYHRRRPGPTWPTGTITSTATTAAAYSPLNSGWARSTTFAAAISTRTRCSMQRLALHQARPQQQQQDRFFSTTPNIKWRVGDVVAVDLGASSSNNNGNNSINGNSNTTLSNIVMGRIVDIKRGGWHTVEIMTDGTSTGMDATNTSSLTVKRRGKDLLVPPSTSTTTVSAGPFDTATTTTTTTIVPTSIAETIMLTTTSTAAVVGNHAVAVKESSSSSSSNASARSPLVRGGAAVATQTALLKPTLPPPESSLSSSNNPSKISQSSVRAAAATTATATAVNATSSLADVFPHVTSSRDAPELPIVAPPPPTMMNWDAILADLRESQLPQRSNDSSSQTIINGDENGVVDSTSSPSSEYLQQLSHFATIRHWVVFTDLHCSSSTLDSCLRVLHIVHDEAVQRHAGILFLGDFWHVRGSIRVDLLNAIRGALSHWTQPMVMIPGNHDQVTAALTDNHSLTPLLHAYRIATTTTPLSSSSSSQDADADRATTLPGVIIFSQPTLFNHALWIPHVRSPAILESILQSPLAQDYAATKAIFCHVDLTGGYMNDNVVSHGGVSPRCFPPNIPIYTGHFHKPHVISRTTYDDESGAKHVRRIEYLGSPYQISLSEAHQSKALVVLEYTPPPPSLPTVSSHLASDDGASAAWTCVDRIPLRIGRRHFRPSTVKDFMALRMVGTEDLVDFERGLDNAVAEEFDATVVRAGDRVVLALEKEQMAELRQSSILSKTASVGGSSPTTSTLVDGVEPLASSMDDQVTRLRKAGALVEVREKVNDWHTSGTTSSSNGDTAPTRAMGSVEDVSPPFLWRAFLDQQVERGSLSDKLQAALLPTGLQIIDEIESNGAARPKSGGDGDAVDGSSTESDSPHSATGASTITRVVDSPFTDPTKKAQSSGFQLESLTLQGFGPFREVITYPLMDRGLVLLRGSNKDGGTDSNGTGKTSLAMSILWALTGTIDPRPVQDAKVSDVVNDASKAAVVTVRGTLHGVPFAISRTKTATKSGLTFMYDGADLTTQSQKETQELMYERLGVNPDVLSRTMFHGQHSLNELLEATDGKLKDELSLIVNLSVWQNAATLTRKKAREASKRVSEFDGMLAIRSSDMVRLQTRLDEAVIKANQTAEVYQSSKLRIQSEMESISAMMSNGQSLESLDDLEHGTRLGEAAIQSLESERAQILENRNVAMAALEVELEGAQLNLGSLETELRRTEQGRDAAVLAHGLALDPVASFQQMWNLDVNVDEFISLPDHCPTCRQSLSGLADHGTEVGGHDHVNILDDVRQQVGTLRSALERAQKELEDGNEAVRVAVGNRQDAVESLSKLQQQHGETIRLWQGRLDELDVRLQEARAAQQSLTAQLALLAKRLETESKLQTLAANLATEQEVYDSTVRNVERIRTELEECQARVRNIETDKASQAETVQVMGDLTDAFGPRGIQTFVLQGAVTTLDSLTSGILNELSEGTQQLKLSLDAGDRIVRRAFVRSDSLSDGGSFKERPLGSLSGGQWRRCSLALTLAFAELVATRAHFVPSLIVLDEPLTHLDQSGRASVGRVLRNLIRRTSEQQESAAPAAQLESNSLHVSTILLILQDLAAVELEECFDCIDDVVKEHGRSTIQLEG